ncbi:uncharacterized protein LOC110697912 [Chenopodium quinoa]|uniref:uncharacterized protein LOC110697912 n=1 Tax=Chenopodium quinoa TaxID=63459 RepID=UPI000B77BF8C|nr:uncharacterized protein LOC110697912 [Chenopodium quinoa]
MLGSASVPDRTIHMSVIVEGLVLLSKKKVHLCRSFSRDDVQKALWSIDEDKAPGPDGFSSKFFKAAWNFVGNDVTDAVLDFFTTGKLLKQMLCERLKEVLPGIIDGVQGPFIKGRSILDNILIFIEDMLVGLGFPDRFVQWIMCCVSTPAFSIMLNVGIHGFFQGKRGIRQGDPVSPLLFVIVMEYLTRLLKKIGKMRGFRFHSRCKSIGLNHLVFADDLMLFCYGDHKSVELLIRGLKTFEKCSGLMANTDKSAIYFGNVPAPVQTQITRTSGFSVGKFPFRYLGIPLNARYLKIADFDSLIDKMLAKISCWSSRHLSYSARTLLVNSMLLSLHTYWAQCLLLPSGVMHRIVQLCRAFLWSGDADWRSYSPKKSGGWAWKKLCVVKEELKFGFEEKGWLDSSYRISAAYVWLQGSMTEVGWHKWIWNSYNVPKHTFISWLAVLNRLRNRSILAYIGVCDDPICLLCGQEEETRDHLFFKFPYSRKCLSMISSWLGIQEQLFSIDDTWISLREQVEDSIKKRCVLAVLVAVVYHIWMARNIAY